MELAELNALDHDSAVRAFIRCCGSSRWAEGMAGCRPFASRDALLSAADDLWRGLDRADILEAFAAHPAIGNDAARQAGEHAGWSAQEQAGVGAAGAALRDRLAAGNRAYRARFGYIFIICASGKSADEMLAALEARLRNEPEVELPIAAGEQARITRLRLAKLMDEPTS